MSKEKTQEVSRELCKYEFSIEEKQEIAQKLADDVDQLHELNDRKKAAMSDFKSAIDTTTASINTASRKIKDGYEMKYMECAVKKDFDKKEVYYIRLDTSEVVRTRPVTDEDLQMRLDEQEEAKEEKKKEEKKDKKKNEEKN
jgi:hypothetical protein